MPSLGLAAFIALLPLLDRATSFASPGSSAVPCEDLALQQSSVRTLFNSVFRKHQHLLIHPEPLMPMASGVLHPRIILPVIATPGRLRVAVSFCCTNSLTSGGVICSHNCARWIAAVWWFQPLAWGALRQLRNESERACDQLVIQFGVRPSDYAAELLAIAKAFTVHRDASAAALAMARPVGLEHRLHSILQPPRPPSQAHLLCSLSAVLLP